MAVLEIGIISDEVSSDFERACQIIAGWGVSHIELRMLWDRNIVQLSDDELERAREIVRSHDLTVTGVASPVFKSPLDGKPREMEADFSLGGNESFEDQMALLERAANVCDRFDTRLVRVFTFWREPWSSEVARDVAAKLARAAQLARDRDIVLAIENEPVCVVGTGAELGKLWELLRADLAPDLLKHLTMLWDPGNALAAGERAFPDGYRALRAADIGHVHLKDAKPGADGKPQFLPVGWGDLGYRGQLEALVADGYDGALVLEPHYRPAGVPQEEAAFTTVKAARELVAEVVG